MLRSGGPATTAAAGTGDVRSGVAERDVLSFCRICSATCGIVVTVDDERVLRVRGDVDHPVSRGYVCAKGRALPQWHHGPERLDHPRVRGHRRPWNEALDDVAARISALTSAHGSDAVGLYTATGMAYDSLGSRVAARWFAALGSRQLYTALTIDNAPAVAAAELIAGSGGLSMVWDHESAEVLVLVGTNPVVSHGYGTAFADPIARLREFRGRGGRVWVLDPRRTETAAHADEHLALRPGTDHLLMAYLLRGLLDDGADDEELACHCDPAELVTLRAAVEGYDAASVARAADVDVDSIERLLAELRRARGRVAVLCGTGATMSRHGLLTCWLRWALVALSGSLDRVDGLGGMRVNPGVLAPVRRTGLGGAPERANSERPQRGINGPKSRPELRHWQGQHPCAAMVDEIEAGHLRGLVVAGGNPLTAFPEASRVRKAMQRLEFLVVLDVVETDLTGLASHVLSVAGQLERADVLVQEAIRLIPGTQRTEAVVAPAGDRRPSWWVFAQLARRMGHDVLAGRDPCAVTDDLLIDDLATSRGIDPVELRATGSRGRARLPTPGWFHDQVLPGGRWRLGDRVILERLAAAVASPAAVPAPIGAGIVIASDGVVEPGRSEAIPGLVLVPRREMQAMNSALYVRDDRPTVVLHPSAAAARRIADGDDVVVSSAHGSLTGVVRIETTLRHDVVSIVHGRRGANVGELTGSRSVDMVTGMPQTSGITIEVERIDPLP